MSTWADAPSAASSSSTTSACPRYTRRMVASMLAGTLSASMTAFASRPRASRAGPPVAVGALELEIPGALLLNWLSNRNGPQRLPRVGGPSGPGYPPGMNQRGLIASGGPGTRASRRPGPPIQGVLAAATILMLGTVPAKGWGASPADAGKRPRLFVLSLRAEQGVSDSSVRLLNEILLSAVQETGRFDAYGESDIVAMVEAEEAKQLAGCDDVMCLAEIGGALGADLSVLGSVGALGDAYVVSLKVIDSRKATVVGRWSSSVQGDPAVLIESVRRGWASIMAQMPPSLGGGAVVDAGPSRPPPGDPVQEAMVVSEEVSDDESVVRKWWFWTLVGGGVAAAVAAGVVAGVVTSQQGGAGGPLDLQVAARLPVP